TAPAGGALTVNGGAAYLNSGTSVSIAATNFSELTGSGLAGNVLTVETGTLSANGCAGYGAPSDITGQTSYTVASGHCYRFTLTGTDKVGNSDSVTATVKVDTTAPSAPSLAFSGLTNAFASGNTVYFESGSTGGFTVTATSTDADSDVASYAYPALTGLSHTAGDYTFDGSSTTQSGDVSATNNAGLTSGTTTFTARA